MKVVESFKTIGDAQLNTTKKGTTLIDLDIEPLMPKRIIWTALNPYFIAANGEWCAYAEVRFSLNKVEVFRYPLSLGNSLLISPTQVEKVYELSGGNAPMLHFSNPAGGGTTNDCFIAPMEFDIMADKISLFYFEGITTQITNFVYGFRVHSSEF